MLPEKIPGWMAEEEGGEFYRADDVEPLLARASAPLDVREALHESLAAMVSMSEPGMNYFARRLKEARLQHAIRVAREALGLTTTDEEAE